MYAKPTMKQINQTHIELIALAFSVAILDPHVERAHWEIGKTDIWDVQVGSSPTWWLRRANQYMSCDLYLETHDREWLRHRLLINQKPTDSNAQKAVRMVAICDHLRSSMNIIITLPWTPDEIYIALTEAFHPIT